MKCKNFDYYIFIDYSEHLLGYLIIENKKIAELLPKIIRFRHFKEARDKILYLRNVKRTFERENICKDLFKIKAKKVLDSPEIYADIAVFLKNHENCIIFISIDDKQYSNFERLVGAITGNATKIIKESQLREGTCEHKLSLILDNFLNIERLRC